MCWDRTDIKAKNWHKSQSSHTNSDTKWMCILCHLYSKSGLFLVFIFSFPHHSHLKSGLFSMFTFHSLSFTFKVRSVSVLTFHSLIIHIQSLIQSVCAFFFPHKTLSWTRKSSSLPWWQFSLMVHSGHFRPMYAPKGQPVSLGTCITGQTFWIHNAPVFKSFLQALTTSLHLSTVQ